MSSSSTGIVVIGMHRSGTSALAGELGRLGIFMGRRLFKAQQGVNDKGFWENAELVKLNELMLDKAGTSWDDPAIYHNLRLDGCRALTSSAAKFVQAEYLDKPLWGMKDPRVSVLLPVWRDVFRTLGVRPNYILMIRHPVEVAQSLARRDGFSTEKALMIWLNYNFESYLQSKDVRRLVIDYADLLADPHSVLRSVANYFDINFEGGGDSFIDNSLHRQSSDKRDFEPSNLMKLAVNLYSAINRNDLDAVLSLKEDYMRLVRELDPVLLEHLASVYASEIHYRSIFEAAYRTWAWKVFSPIRRLEMFIRHLL